MRVVQVPVVSDPPVIDAVEARWAAEAVGSLARQLDTESMVAMCLDRARHELLSLAASAEVTAAGAVIGPLRVKIAA